MELRVGGIYRAKKPQKVGYGDVNDRQIIWIDVLGTELQYDSPSIPLGGKYKRCSTEDFVKWVGEDVSGKLPADDWMSWENYLATKSQNKLK